MPDGGFYPAIGLSALLSLSLSMIRKNCMDYLAAVGRELLAVKFWRGQRRIRFSHEAVNHVVRVEKESGHRPVWSNAVDVRTLAGACARARNVELNERAVLVAYETVIHICCVNIPSCDGSTRIDSKRVGALERTCVPGAWRIERSENAIRIPEETVTNIIRVKVVSHDGSLRSKAPAISALTGTRAGARNIVRRDDAILIPQKTVARVVRVKVESCNLPDWADCEAKRTLASSRTRAWGIEGGEGATLSRTKP
jgi:hypothetical protein